MSKILYKELSYKLNGLFFKAHKELGRFRNEKEYSDYFENLLKQENIAYEREYRINNENAPKTTRNICDFLVEKEIIIEFKSKNFITKEDYYQTQRYLSALNLDLGIIVNFRQTRLSPKRVLNSESTNYSDSTISEHSDYKKHSGNSDTNSEHSDYMPKGAKIYIAGHRGLVGSAILRKLQSEGYTNLVTRTRQELDLLNAQAVSDFFAKEKPEYVFLAAAKVGGILANRDFGADFIYENLTVQNNVIHNAYLNKTKKLLFLGSSCIYPKLAPQPIKEEYLMTGELEPTNEAYAIAKIAGIKMCQNYNKQYGTNFISVMPTNLYGPNDNFDLENSHVLPAMIRKFHDAKINNEKVTLWGTGSPKREFLHVDDLADAVIYLMQNYNDSEIINIGTGEDISIKELAETIQKTVGFEGEITWDTEKPDGTPRKWLDVSKLHSLGWKNKINLSEGIKNTYEWFIDTLKK